MDNKLVVGFEMAVDFFLVESMLNTADDTAFVFEFIFVVVCTTVDVDKLVLTVEGLWVEDDIAVGSVVSKAVVDNILVVGIERVVDCFVVESMLRPAVDAPFAVEDSFVAICPSSDVDKSLLTIEVL